MKSTIRIDDGLLDKLRLLKDVTGSRSYQKCMEALVHSKLMEYFAYTEEGYLSVGNVVEDANGNTLVITSIVDGMVIFNDSSYVLNGGCSCMKLTKLVDSVAEHTGRVKI